MANRISLGEHGGRPPGPQPMRGPHSTKKEEKENETQRRLEDNEMEQKSTCIYFLKALRGF